MVNILLCIRDSLHPRWVFSPDFWTINRNTNDQRGIAFAGLGVRPRVRHSGTLGQQKIGPGKVGSQQVTNMGQSIWVFPKIMIPPNHPILIGFSINYKPSILGYPYFWKHPYNPNLGVFSNFSFNFHPLQIGNDPIWRAYCSDGLKPSAGNTRPFVNQHGTPRWLRRNVYLINSLFPFVPSIWRSMPLPSLKLTVRPWKWMVWKMKFPFGKGLFSAKLLVLGSVILISGLLCSSMKHHLYIDTTCLFYILYYIYISMASIYIYIYIEQIYLYIYIW